MSGIEVAGVVLGVLPLVITALQSYGEGVNTIERWMSYQRELKVLQKAVLAEHVMFLNTCEIMLVNVVQDDELQSLLNDPGGPHWTDAQLNTKLEANLGRSYEACLTTIGDISNVVQQLAQELQMDIVKADANAKPNSLFTREQILRVKVSLTRGSLKTHLQNLEKHNTVLMRLTQQSVELSTTKGRRRNTRPAKELTNVRRQLTNLYNAVNSSLPQKCPHGHHLYLELASRLDGDKQEKSKESYPNGWFRAQFHIQQSDLSASLRQSILFEPFQIVQPQITEQSADPHASEQIASIPRPHASAVAKNIRNESPSFSLRSVFKRSRKTRPEEESKAPNKAEPWQNNIKLWPATLHGPQEQTPPQQQVNAARNIRMLCTAVQRKDTNGSPKSKVRHHLGYLIAEEPDAMNVYQIDKSSEDKSEILQPLSSALESLRASRETVPQRDRRYQMALTLASSTFQLCETPWLLSVWSNKDIALNWTLPSQNGLFFCKSFSELPGGQKSSNLQAPGIRNIPVFKLGICLIELCFWKPISALRSSDDVMGGSEHSHNLLSDLSTASRLLLDVGREAGVGYADVVRRCIFCDFDQRSNSFQHEAFRAAFFASVISPLQKICTAFSGAMDDMLD